MSFITVHILRSLPMHNLNRDQNGLPKSQFDGGIQRGRLSSQSIKRPARIAFREAIKTLDGASGSIRTMDSNAAKMVVALAEDLAGKQSVSLDSKAARKSADSVIKSLAKNQKEAVGEGATKPKTGAEEISDKKDNILLFSDAELETLAQAIVDEQNGADAPTVDQFVLDFKSPSLDVAAFGRMFAAKANKSTLAAVAVSHAVMTHEMSLTIDYFTAVDEFRDEDEPATDAGAGHLGIAYYTSGVYYSTFTVDPAQLRRSWSGISAPSAEGQVRELIRALVVALPTGKLTNTNAHTPPFLVLVEEQRGRSVYEFDTPVTKGIDGGFSLPSAQRLLDQVALARQFDSRNYLSSKLYCGLDISIDETTVDRVGDLDELVGATVAMILSELGG